MPFLPVAWRAQSQNDGVCDLDHGLQGGGHHDEEDDAEEEGALHSLHVQQAGLQGEQQQGDALGHASERKEEEEEELRWRFPDTSLHIKLFIACGNNLIYRL